MSNIDFSRGIPVGPDTQARQQDEARICLKATDWYVIRQVETGIPVPEDIAKARAEARVVLS
ncbi:MAG: hypothetical protein ACRBB0_09075 [Pelagimonas sp.]|uniref:hypothetical protein n=1 Tax=Pelagimonas sp. TaxID=2073170 RepID=UPI003D6A65F6